MFTLKQAKRHAQQMADLHREPWAVFITPAAAPCNHGAMAIYNTGRFMACRLAERDEYEAGGAQFPKIGGAEIVLSPRVKERA